MYISLPQRGDRSKTGAPAARVSSVVITLGVVSMLTDVSSESVASILPLYITGAMGLSMIAYGFIDGIYQGVSAIVRIGGGWASDRTDNPKWVAFFGYAVSAVTKVGLLFVSGFAGIASVIALDRLGKGVRTAPRDALITASSEPSNLGKSFGVHRMLDTIGAAGGPLLAFLILFFVPTGYHLVFIVSLGFAVVGVVILGLVVPARRPRRESVAAGEARQPFRWGSLAEPRLRRLILTAGILAVLTVGDGFIYLVLQDRSPFAAQWFPLLYVGTNVAFFIFAVPLGRFADRFGRARVFVLGHVALLAAYACAALPVGGAAVTIVCLVLLGAFYAATDGVLAALAGEVCPPESRATGIAAAQTVVAIGRLIGSTAFGILWFAAGRELAVVIVAAALAAAIPALLVLIRPLTRVAVNE
ncbi:MFS transporter [Conyzicola nivalis]|uniref:MFS transporter n=1 Tax=Conyzicola nivalis TaxID=1477021 RepID=A0A916WKI4_9MICO|nr:MFS transporter [Conyzicola nivalis]GGB10210.1 MFS transporter [Conyzicola nivalis]